MTSLGVAPATSSRVPVPVRKRELLWSDGVIEMKVPADARYGEFKNKKEGDVLPFLKFARSIKGGMINFFVHDNLKCHEQKIRAEVQVWRKEHEDGRTFLYVDLLPTKAAVTHRLVVVSTMPGMQSVWPKGSMLFETPTPLYGAIVLLAPDQKM